MTEYKIKRVSDIEGPIGVEGPNGIEMLIKLNFATDSDERLTLILTRNAASDLRDAFSVASASLRPK